MKDLREKDIQFEKLRDTAERFVAEQYESNGFYMHFHRNPELYCVVKGEVLVTVRGGGRKSYLPRDKWLLSADWKVTRITPKNRR